MDKSLVALLAVMAVFDAVSLYFGFINPPKFMSRYSKGAFVVLTFMLIPFVAYVLHGQSTALERLKAETGVMPHPAITHSVGISTGAIISGTWLFSADASPQEVLGFYDEEKNRPGWEPVSQSPVMCLFTKDGRKLTIAANREFDKDPTMVLYRLD